MYESILLPTNGARGVNDAVEHAIQLASEVGATLHILYVTMRGGDQFRSSHESTAPVISDDAERVNDAIVSHAREAGVEIETHVKQGKLRQTTIAFSREHDIDLIVVPAENKTRFYHQLTDTLAEKVAREPTPPVLAVSVDSDAIQGQDVYECLNCDNRFQTTVGSAEDVQCPFCGNSNVKDRTLG